MSDPTPLDALPLTPAEWHSPSSDPNDETFGDVVDAVDPDAGFDAHDAVLVGEPFDGAVLGRPGAAAGPDAIRETLAGVKTHHLTRGAVADGAGTVADAGNVRVGGVTDTVLGPDADLDAVREAVTTVAGALHDSSATPVFLGGDNSLTVPNVGQLLATVPHDETIGVVNLDAHLDVREVREGPTSGTPYRELLDAGLDEYAVVGVRDFETSTRYVNYLDERGGTVVTAEAVRDDVDAALSRARDAVADVDHRYVSVDCDVLDAAAAPGVSAPTPGGVTTRELFRVVADLTTDDRLRGVEVVECAPPLDEGGRTVAAAARTVAHALAGIVHDDPTEELA